MPRAVHRFQRFLSPRSQASILEIDGQVTVQRRTHHPSLLRLVHAVDSKDGHIRLAHQRRLAPEAY